MIDELDVDDILDNVDLLAPHQTTEIQKFLKAPDLESFKKIRNDLLRTQDALDNKFICWNAAFLKALTEDQRNANPSKEFDERVAEKKNRQNELQKSIITVSKQWGKEIVKHYHWISEGEHYCNKLRTIAVRIPKWSEAVEILNQSLVERVAGHARDKRIKNVEGANSIRLWDLKRITQTIRGTNVPPTRVQPNELPDGYGRDRFGLIVEAEFATKSQFASLQGSAHSARAIPASCDNDESISTAPLLGSPGESINSSQLAPSPLRSALPETSTVIGLPSITPSILSNKNVINPSELLPTSPSLTAIETPPSLPVVFGSEKISPSQPFAASERNYPYDAHCLSPRLSSVSSKWLSSLNVSPIETPSPAATVAFDSSVDKIEVTTNSTRSPSSALPTLPPLSPNSLFHHEANQSLTATSNCRIDGAVNRTVAPYLSAKPKCLKKSSEIAKKRPRFISHDLSPKKQKGSVCAGGHYATALIKSDPLISDHPPSPITSNTT